MARLCRVSDHLETPERKPLQGSLRFLANRTGLPITGGLILPAPVIVELDAGGNFKVDLTPSAIVGEYTLRAPHGNYIVAVPDAPSARLRDIIVWGRGP